MPAYCTAVHQTADMTVISDVKINVFVSEEAYPSVWLKLCNTFGVSAEVLNLNYLFMFIVIIMETSYYKT